MSERETSAGLFAGSFEAFQRASGLMIENTDLDWQSLAPALFLIIKQLVHQID